MNTEYMTIDDFADEVGVSSATVYRWLIHVPNKQTKSIDGLKHYADSTLYEALRKSKMLGVRDIQGKMGVALRDLKLAGFPGYAVSKVGKVYNTDKNGRNISTRKRASDGYWIVDLGSYGTQHLHRLVAAAYLGLPYRDTQQVDHIDGNKSNNRLENLEWVTPNENLKRRNTKLFSNPHRPFKYTRTELGYLKSAFVHGLKYREFCDLHPDFTISGTHYRRLNSKCPAAGKWPEWEDVVPDKRFAIAMSILGFNSFFAVEDEVEFYANLSNYNFDSPMTPEEFVMVSSWLDSSGIREDLESFIKEAEKRHNQTGQYEYLNLSGIRDQLMLYRNKLRYMASFPFFYHKGFEMWWSKPINEARVRVGEAPWEYKGYGPNICMPETADLARLGIFR